MANLVPATLATRVHTVNTSVSVGLMLIVIKVRVTQRRDNVNVKPVGSVYIV